MALRLVVWAPCLLPSTSQLPMLDPDGLYAASILQAQQFANYSLSPASSLLHSRLPCLEETSTGVVLAKDVDGIERYAETHAVASASALLDDCCQGGKGRRWARGKALERYLLSTLHPLVHQLLFSQQLYPLHTAKVYQSGLPFLTRASLINRLRTGVRDHYALQARCLMDSSHAHDGELGAILAERNTRRYMQEEEDKERQDLADRGGISINGRMRKAARRGDGMLREEKAEAAKAFSEMRLQSFTQEVLQVFVEAIGEGEYLLGTEKPSLVDLRLFSLLAPLLLPPLSYPALAASSLPTLLRSSYPSLVAHTQRLQALIWPIQEQPMLEASVAGSSGIVHRSMVYTPGWPDLPGRESDDGSGNAASAVPLTIRLARGLGWVCGQSYHYASTLLAPPSAPGQQNAGVPSRPAAAEKQSSKPPHMTEVEKKEARRVAIGRWVWISSAVLGLIGTAFASGLLAIELVDEGDEGEETQVHGLGQSERVEEEEQLEEIVDDGATEVDEDDDFEVQIIDDDDEDGFEGMTEEEFEFEEDE